MNVTLGFVLALMLAPSVPQQNLSVPLKELRNAPATVVLDNKSLRLSTYPWRDFSPGSVGLDGTRMMVAVKVMTDDKQPMPSGIRIDRVWVLYGDQSWEVSDLRGRQVGHELTKDPWRKCGTSPECEVSLQGGPMWGPGVYVDIVVRLTDSKGKEYFLQAPNQYVHVTN